MAQRPFAKRFAGIHGQNFSFDKLWNMNFVENDVANLKMYSFILIELKLIAIYGFEVVIDARAPCENRKFRINFLNFDISGIVKNELE